MRKIGIYARYLSLLFFLWMGLQAAEAQEESSSSWQLKGFVDTYHALQVQHPNDFIASRTRVRAEVEKTFGASSLFVSFNATHNALLKERTGFDLREAYLDHREKHWGFRLGRQLVIWGMADGVRITDLVSPMDMVEFLAQDYDDIRMSVNALRFFTFNDKMKLELLLVPTFQGYKLPTSADNPWSILPREKNLPIVWDESESNPAFKLSNVEYGGRLSFTLPGVDFSLSGLYTWNKMPVLSYKLSPEGLVVSPNYYRMGFLGGDISKPLGQLVLRGEAAFNVDKHFNYKPEQTAFPQKGFNTLNWLVGVDWYAPREWILMAQFSSESIFKYEPQIAQREHSALLTLSISKKLLESTLQISNFTYYDLMHKGWFSRFSADYALNDQIRLVVGCDWLGGKEGIFSNYKRNSEVWMKAKYSF